MSTGMNTPLPIGILPSSFSKLFFVSMAMSRAESDLMPRTSLTVLPIISSTDFLVKTEKPSLTKVTLWLASAMITLAGRFRISSCIISPWFLSSCFSLTMSVVLRMISMPPWNSPFSPFRTMAVSSPNIGSPFAFLILTFCTISF